MGQTDGKLFLASLGMKEITCCLPKDVNKHDLQSLWCPWSLLSRLMCTNRLRGPPYHTASEPFPLNNYSAVAYLGKLTIISPLAAHKVVQFHSDMLCPSNMAGSSELKRLWELPILRGQSYTTHFLLSTGSGFRLAACSTWGRLGGGKVLTEISMVLPWFLTVCDKLPPTVKDHVYMKVKK